MNAVATTPRCPRCSLQLRRSRDPEISGVCDRHGPQYVAALTPAEAAAEQMASAGKQRRRGARTPATVVGWDRDGCDVSPSCLECPLERCIFDREEDKPMEAKTSSTNNWATSGGVSWRRATPEEVEQAQRVRARPGKYTALLEACQEGPVVVDAGDQHLKNMRGRIYRAAKERGIRVTTVGVPGTSTFVLMEAAS